jgi:hypothetical protein
MNQIRPGSGASAAVLAGSLAVFPLLDVLGLLARTRHAGKLHVVADGVEASLWVDGGDLLDHSPAAADRLFELACLDDAWFTVSSAPLPARGERGERVALEPLLEQVAPHVAEWQSLIKALPFGALARMSPAMPGPEAQIRSDQWRILSLIGTGRPVHEVVDVSDGKPLETLRLIHELAQKELIVVEVPAAGARRRTARVGDEGAPRRAEPAGEPDRDPDAASAEEDVVAAGSGRATTTPLVAKRPAAVRAVVAGEEAPAAAPPGTDPAPEAAAPTPAAPSPAAPTPAAGQSSPDVEPARRPAARAPAASRRPGHHAVAPYMPPPVTPSFWPALAADSVAEPEPSA